MIRSFTISLLVLITIGLKAQPISYYMSVRYHDPLSKPYLDLIFDIDGNSLQPTTETDSSQQFIAQVQVKIRNEKDSLINSANTLVSSPFFGKDSPEKPFLHLERLAADAGINKVEITLLDMSCPDSSYCITSFKEQVYLEENRKFSAFLSDLIFLGDVIPAENTGSPFERNGALVLPYLSDFFHSDLNKILFYTEIYNSKQQFPGGKFAYSYQIVHPQTKEILFGKRKIKRAETETIVPIIGSFDLSDVPNGKYLLRIELRNTLNEVLISQEKAFTRENRNYEYTPGEIEEKVLANSFVGSITSDSLMNEYIACLFPIADRSDRPIVLHPEDMRDIDVKKRFFLDFWMQKNSTQPSLAWYQYKKNVDLTDRLFSTSIKRGYESDRGRVYLEYGNPSSRMDRPSEPLSYPYEIWQYNNIEVDGTNFSNVRFVFYNPSIATNDYQLLHSELRGEIKNPQWQNQLQKRTSPINRVDPNPPPGSFGNQARDLYDDPR